MTEDIIDSLEAKPIIILQPFRHFFILSLCSCGVYPMIWAYSVWRQLRTDGEMFSNPVLDVVFHPIVRVFFDWLFSFSLYRHVTQAALKKNCIVDYSPFLFAMAFSFLRMFSQQLVFPWFLLIFIFWVPYIPLFFTWRHYLEAKEVVCVYREKLRLWEVAILALGIYGSLNIMVLALYPELLSEVKSMYGLP